MPCLCHRVESHDLLNALRQGRSSLDDRMPFAEPGVGPHYGPDRTVAIEHYDLDLSIEPVERSYRGKATIRFRVLPTHKGKVELDCDEFTVDAVTDGAGKALPWSTADGRLVIGDVDGDGVLVVTWHGKDPQRGLYFTGPIEAEPNRQHMAWTQCQDEDAHFFVPCQDHPGVKHPWTVRLDGPAGYTLLSNGALVEQGEANGRAWAKFEQAQGMPAYLLTAVCAKLTAFETSWRGKKVRYLVPVGEEEAVQRSMGRTPQMMDEFSRRTGVEFAWPRYDQVVVHDFIFGGMENTACTTMTRLLLVDEKAAMEWEADHLVAHELAHQWFGDLVTCQDWSQGWLNESWATFMEVVWFEHARSAEDAIWARWEQAQGYFEEEGGRYRRPIVAYDFREPIDVFDRHLYEKGGCVLATLRTTLGEDAFWTGVKTYLERHKYQTVHSRHFQRALEDATGKNLDRFFQDWVHSPGHPSLDVKLGQEDGLVTVTVKQTQDGEGVPKEYHFPLRVEIVDAQGRATVMDLPVRERERTWAIPSAGDVTTVRVDPGFRVLADVKIDGPRGWLEKLANDADPVLALRAARALLEDGGKPAWTAVLATMTSHPSHHVRGDVAGMVGKRGGSDARDALLAALDAEADPRVKRRIVDALGAFREKGVADALIAHLEAGEPATWHLHGAYLVALGKTRDPRAKTVIPKHLDVRCWNDQVAQSGLSGLAETEDPEVLDTLLARSRGKYSQRVRAAAARALGKLGDKVEPTRGKAVERLCEMLTEPGFRTQLGAITGLGTLKDARALGPLDQVHRSAPDGRTRRMAYEASVKIKKGRTSEEALAGLRKQIDALAEENHKLRIRIDKLEK